jgi:hypothetical protein
MSSDDGCGSSFQCSVHSTIFSKVDEDKVSRGTSVESFIDKASNISLRTKPDVILRNTTNQEARFTLMVPDRTAACSDVLKTFPSFETSLMVVSAMLTN